MASEYQVYEVSAQRRQYDISPNDDRYPYPPMASTSTTTTAVSSETIQGGNRAMIRTPSPTPSEQRELKSGAIDWKSMGSWRFWIRKEWAWYYVALVIILVVTALVTVYHKQIVHWLTPAANWLHDLSCGWLVPIAVLFVISFPPLFGHEIVAILCGVVWGLWKGFGIVAAGTFLGEVGNFYAFKYCCRARGEKLERTKISYACLAKVVRDGGFKIALIARLSAIPGHFTTAVFSTCGMGIIVFSIAAILSLPKQFITVYLGVILEQSDNGTQNKKSKIISDVVLAITFAITIIAMWYILRQMNKVKPDIIYAKRKARQAKMIRAQMPYMNHEAMSSDSTITLQNDSPTSYTPLSDHTQKPALDQIYAPHPQRLSDANAYQYPKDEEEGYSTYGHPSRRGKDIELSVVRESSEEIGWDMNARNTNDRNHTPLPPGIPIPGRPTFGENTGPMTSSPKPLTSIPMQSQGQPLKTQKPPSTDQSHSLQNPPHNPSFNPSVSSQLPPYSDPYSLPTPPYVTTQFHEPLQYTNPATTYHSPHLQSTNPFNVPPYTSVPSHGQEPTDASFHTAWSSTHSRGPTDEDVGGRPQSQPQRGISPQAGYSSNEYQSSHGGLR